MQAVVEFSPFSGLHFCRLIYTVGKRKIALANKLDTIALEKNFPSFEKIQTHKYKKKMQNKGAEQKHGKTVTLNNSLNGKQLTEILPLMATTKTRDIVS